uniref:Uncharacterized protein n=1 Tax=Junco hyemalis TaxID=40217 RepID=A0A8C5NNV6_JUNHY
MFGRICFVHNLVKKILVYFLDGEAEPAGSPQPRSSGLQCTVPSGHRQSLFWSLQKKRDISDKIQ